MQLHLNFPPLPLPLDGVWEQLSEDDRTAALEALAQLLAKTASAETDPEENHD